MSRRNRLKFAVIGVVASVLLHLVNWDWNWHERFNLLLRGYPFAHVELATAHSANLPHAFAHDLVYQGKAYVGYVNPYGDFVLATDPVGGFPVTSELTPWLMLLEICGIGVVVGLIIWCFLPLPRGRGFDVVVIKGRENHT